MAFHVHRCNITNIYNIKFRTIHEGRDVNNTYSSIINSIPYWGRVTHICVGNLTIIGSDNGLSPGWRQAIIWTNAGILLIGPLGTNFSEIFTEIITFSSKKMYLKVSSAKWRPFCLGLNVFNNCHMDKVTQFVRDHVDVVFKLVIRLSIT